MFPRGLSLQRREHARARLLAVAAGAREDSVLVSAELLRHRTQGPMTAAG